MNINEQLETIIKEVEEIQHSNDAWYILCKMSNSIDTKKKHEPSHGVDKNMISTLIDSVFNNQKFITLLEDVLQSNEKSKTYTKSDSLIEPESEKENKKFLKLFVQIAFFYIATHLDELDYQIIVQIRAILTKKTNDCVKAVRHEFSIENILMMIIETTMDPAYNVQKPFPFERLPFKKLNTTYFFDTLIITQNLIIGSFASIVYFNFIGKSLKVVSKSKKLKKSHFRASLNKVYGASKAVEGRLDLVKKRYNEKFVNDNTFEKYIDNFRTVNEKVVSIIIQRITNGFQKENANDLWQNRIDQKLTKIEVIKQEIIDYCENHLGAFNGNVISTGGDWSNKVFLITIELLSVIEEVKKAKDVRWKRQVAKRSLDIWVSRLHEIINRNELLDEWNEIKELLNQENRNIEWKSSFLTPLEQNVLETRDEQRKEKALLFIIAKTMLGMMNADGGFILIGLSEHPEKIVQKDALNHIITKNGITFYDIRHELKAKSSDIDCIKRKLQDLLKEETLLSIDKLDQYWNVASIELADDNDPEKHAIVYKITVNKSEKPIFSARNERERISIEIIKRVNGRNTYQDPREFFAI